MSSLMIVDDSPSIIELYTVVLETEGYEVKSAKSPEEAIALLRSGYSPHVMFVDIRLDGVLADEFLEHATSERLIERNQTRVVGFSSVAPPSEIQERVNPFLDAFVVKPCTIEEIVNIVRMHFESYDRRPTPSRRGESL